MAIGKLIALPNCYIDIPDVYRFLVLHEQRQRFVSIRRVTGAVF